jgi:hypothetical protein
VARSLDPFTKANSDLRNQICWDVDDDTQLGLSMQIGQPHLEIREPYATKARTESVRRMATCRSVHICGEWFLWVTHAYWRVIREGVALASSSSSLRAIKRALCWDLDGQRFVDLQVNPSTGFTRFHFDLQTVLEVRRFDRQCEYEIWMLYKPNGWVLSVFGDGTYLHAPGSGRDKRREVRRPIPSTLPID